MDISLQKSFLGLMTLTLLLPLTAPALETKLEASTTTPVCYSQDDLMRDLKYGNCQALSDKKPEDINFCPELSDRMKNNPQGIAMQIFEKINEGNFFSTAMSCKSTANFIEKSMRANSVLESPVLFRFAKKCSSEGILFARIFGAKEVVDKKTKLTPSLVIQKEIDQQNVRLAVETDAPKSTELKKHIDQCNKALLSLSQPQFKLEDIRSLKFPTDAKVVLLKAASKHGLADDSIQRTISSGPATPTVPTTATAVPTGQ